VCAAAVAFYAYLLGPLFRSLILGDAVRIGPWVFEGNALFWKIPLLLVTVAAVKAVSQWLHNGWMQAIAQAVLGELRQVLYGRLLHLPPRFFDERHSGELLTRFTSDIAQLEFSVSLALGSYVKDSLTVLALLVECYWVDPRLFLLAFIVLPAAGIPVSRFARSVKKATRRTQGSLGALTELVSEHVQNLPIVQTYRGEARGLETFAAEEGRYFGAMKRSLFLRGAFTPTLELLGIVGVAAVIGVGARWVGTEPDLATKLPSFLAATLLLYQPLKALSGTFGQTLQGVASAERLFDITDRPGETDEGATAPRLASEVVFRDVTFAYNPGDAALQALSLTVPAGKKVALVGASGSGKSTLFSLLLRLRDPTGGTLTWDGQDVTALSRHSVRAQLGWVPQEPLLFSGSVRDNLKISSPEADDEALWNALGRAHARDFVESLEGALDATIGEGGRKLSGGQRQRLSIARAFLKEPALLLLDEPTSALDSASEAEVQAGLTELMKGRTCLIIAHRLSTVRNADLLYVLNAGAVVESGPPQVLERQNGPYADFLRAGHLTPADPHR
jgi:ATP-binding cassette, subfamily B, bacterial MsbA